MASEVFLVTVAILVNGVLGGGDNSSWSHSTKGPTENVMEMNLLSNIPIGVYAKCVAENNIQDELLLDLLKYSFTSLDPKLNCFLKCVLVKAGVITGNNIDCDAVKELLLHKKMSIKVTDRLNAEYLCDRCKELFLQNINPEMSNNISHNDQSTLQGCNLAYKFIQCGTNYFKTPGRPEWITS